MKKTDRLLALSLSLVAALSVGCRSGGEAHRWTYTGATGPEHWAELSPAYVLAETGLSQSPIDISTTELVPSNGPELEVAYGPTPLAIENSGHTVVVHYAPGSQLRVGDEAWDLAQFQFHSPSEHTIDGRHAPLEVHLVHTDSEGGIAVVGVLVQEGVESPFLAQIWPHLPVVKTPTATVEGVSVNVSELLPTGRATFRYSGSLTTPPCTEGVDWFLLQEPRTASAEQLVAFRRAFSGNNRPVQALNGRVVHSNR